MKIVCPTITAENPHTYREQIERVASFTHHVHLDIMDGKFTPNTSISLEQLWMPDGMTCDVHAMYQDPESALSEVEKLSVRTFIVPAESDCNFKRLSERVHKAGMFFGVALLADTAVQDTLDALKHVDHVLIFSGNLGYQGGSTADLALLAKIAQIKVIHPKIEIGWDGGLNDQNISQIAQAGVTVFNVGGFIHFAPTPSDAFATLSRIVK